MLRNGTGTGMSNIKTEPQMIEHGQAPGMSLWAQVRELEGDALTQIQNLYGPNFPIEFRHYFADIIESRRWDQLDPDNIHDEPQARHILESFLNDIERQCENLTEARDFLQRLRFSEIANHFKAIYGPAPLELVRTAKKILSIESSLVNQSSSLTDGGILAHLSQQTEKVIHVNRELDRLSNMTRDTDNDLRKLQSKQEYFVINYQESLKISANLQQVQQMPPNDQTRMQVEPKLIRKQQEVDSLLRLEAQKLLQLRVGIADKHKETFTILNNLQNQILDEELIQWKRAQALAYNGVQHENNLDQLQQWCERLAEIIWQNRQQIKKVELQRQQLPINNPGRDLLPELNSTITGLLSTLVTSTFIIEKQPPQVLKTQTRFGATIRLLVGGKLNIHMNPPTVKASIISESQAKALLRNESKSLSEMSGEILNRESVMEYHHQTGVLSVNFRNMSLRRIKRSDKRGAESVTEEKFTVLFQSQFSVGGNELVFQVRPLPQQVSRRSSICMLTIPMQNDVHLRAVSYFMHQFLKFETLSLPVVVIVHGNQEANAAASILWDNAFAEQGRTPFQVPDKVPWCKLVEALDHKWKHETRSPRGLTSQAKQYLAYKVFKQVVMPNSEKNISWAQFNREPLPKRNFTFWQWFNGVMELTKSKHLQVHWNDGAIIGFIGKAESQDKLLSMPNRTFLLRYSDSEIGGLTIAWVAEDKGIPKVWNLQPQTLRDYGIRSLADRIKDLEQLMYLCNADDTTKLKDEIFGQYYSKAGSSTPQPDGYVRTELMQHIPGIAPVATPMGMFSDTSAPSTPRSAFDSQLMHNSPPPSNSHSGNPIPFDVGSPPIPSCLYYDGASEAGSNSNFPQNDVNASMEYDESLGDQFESCNIDVNELLSRHM